MNDLYKKKREILKIKRDLRKKVMQREGELSSHMRVYGESAKVKRAIRVEMGLSKSKKSAIAEGETALEKFVENVLNENNIEFKTQKRIRYLNYDVFIPECNLFIEVNGEYWHVDKRIYPNGPKNEIQKRGIAQTEKKKEFAEEAGVAFLEVWEEEIEKKPELTKKMILSIIDNLRKNPVSGYKFFTSMDWVE